MTKFTLTMQGGKKGLLVNSNNLCKAVNEADVRMTGQNGKTYNTKPRGRQHLQEEGKKKPQAQERGEAPAQSQD